MARSGRLPPGGTQAGRHVAARTSHVHRSVRIPHVRPRSHRSDLAS